MKNINRADELWMKLKGDAVRILCRNKCAKSRPGDICVDKDVFFPREEAVLKPEEYASGEELNDLMEYISMLRKKQENGREFYCNGVLLTIKDDLSVKAKDISKVWVLFYDSRNAPKAFVVFRDDIRFVKYKNTIYQKAPEHPIGFMSKGIDAYSTISKVDVYCGDKETGENIKDEEVHVSMASVRRFYSFDVAGWTPGGRRKTVSFVKFTNAVRKKYRNSMLYSELTRYEPNMNGSTCWLGGYPCIWQNDIISYSQGSFHMDEIIEREELDAVLRGISDNALKEELTECYEDMRMSEEEYKQIVDKANDEVQKVQGIINGSGDRIIDAVCREFGINTSAEKDEKIRALKVVDKNMGLDVGFLYFRFTDKEREKLVKRAGRRTTSYSRHFYPSGKFDVSMPFECQSTTIKRYEAAEAAKILKENGIAVTYCTILD